MIGTDPWLVLEVRESTGLRVWVWPCMRGRGWRPTLNVSLSHSPLCFLRQGPSLNLDWLTSGLQGPSDFALLAPGL